MTADRGRIPQRPQSDFVLNSSIVHIGLSLKNGQRCTGNRLDIQVQFAVKRQQGRVNHPTASSDAGAWNVAQLTQGEIQLVLPEALAFDFKGPARALASQVRLPFLGLIPDNARTVHDLAPAC